MRKVETDSSAPSEVRKEYFLAALRELHERTPDGSSTRQFELTEIAQHASRLDPDYEPRSRFEKILAWFGVEIDEDPEAVHGRERRYLERHGEARRIMDELVETGEAVEVPIAPVLLLDAGSDYGRHANEDGKLYGVPAPVLEAVG